MRDRDHSREELVSARNCEMRGLSYNSATMAAVRQIFVGRDGIRAGWRFLIFVALVVVFRIAAFRVPPVWRLLKSTESGTLTPFSDGTAAVLSALTAFLAAFIMSQHREAPPDLVRDSGPRSVRQALLERCSLGPRDTNPRNADHPCPGWLRLRWLRSARRHAC